MDDDSTRETVPHYRAFISYSHADDEWRRLLRTHLELPPNYRNALIARIMDAVTPPAKPLEHDKKAA